MNWLDFIMIFIIAIITLGAMGLTGMAIQEREPGMIGGIFITWLILTGVCMLPFLVIDKAAGATIGTITAVDRNFFGTTAVFIKTSETEQEEYCIENDEIKKVAVNSIGKKVKVKYGTRVGLYSTGACSQAPIKEIKIIEE
jgi:hypothetical protein